MAAIWVVLGDDGCGGHESVSALFVEGVVAEEGEGEGGQLVAGDDGVRPEVFWRSKS